MNKSKFFILIITGLVLINGILSFILFQDHRRKEGPKNIVIEKLHFDKEQIKNYEVYIQQHRHDINENETTMNTLRSSLYEELKHAANGPKVDSLIAKIGSQQILAEHINYNHFLEIKKICKQHQEKDFEELTKEISHLFSPKQRK